MHAGFFLWPGKGPRRCGLVDRLPNIAERSVAEIQVVVLTAYAPPLYNTSMEIFLYIFSALFILFALGILFAYTRKPHPGLLLMAAAYGGGAGAAIALVEGWPLLAGIGVAWVVKMIGLDPDSRKR